MTPSSAVHHKGETQNFMTLYFGRFRRFYGFMQKQKRDCREQGYVRTITGRYRRIAEIRSTDFWKMSHAQRQSVSCLHGATEALTERGWVQGFSLRHDDVLLTRNAHTGALEWEPMTGVNLQPNRSSTVPKVNY